MLLALDTSTAAVTAAVHSGAPGTPGTVLAVETVVDARGAGEHLAPAAHRALARAGVTVDELTDIVVGVGPGPFTGLRVGIVTGRVLALTSGAALHGVCSLDALAADARERGVVAADQPLLVATDARRKEVYWAVYPRDVHRSQGPQVGPAAELPDDVRELPALGAGVALYPDALTGGIPDLPTEVDAGVLARLAADHPEVLTSTEPLYLRRPDSQVPGQRKRVLL
ncbi:tRNA (adenosine(37)-N6)-threonylcarbamoyltransferase complex dimerization subunit type 1 TsaB [Kytococcus sedentarius]|uniref:tRNA (adenosine(37)-N6)-threonylcarbamoyltransferase complex dimerization subunit type 1 TsaB n=1 Tax=Kytococcus sedentarius TaxID=1276 RepID=UPI0035BC620A